MSLGRRIAVGLTKRRGGHQATSPFEVVFPKLSGELVMPLAFGTRFDAQLFRSRMKSRLDRESSWSPLAMALRGTASAKMACNPGNAARRSNRRRDGRTTCDRPAVSN